METLTSEKIGACIGELTSQDVLTVQQAHESLVGYGRSAVPALLRALDSKNEQTRWEAARVLGEIGDPIAAPALVKALTDQNFVVRWISSEALVQLGHGGLAPLLSALENHSESVWLRRGAHRVLRVLATGKMAKSLDAVMNALESIEPTLDVPIACANALHRLAAEPQYRTKE